MAGKSWDFHGESKDWSNVLEHRWIRSKFITGWSAAEGGPGDSSHQRNDLVQTRLRRSCVMNQRGGPQDTEATDGHAAKAAHTLAVVDAERRAEFHRKKYMAEINDGLEKERVSNRIKQNFGWPFWEGGRNVKMKTPVDETEDQRAERERAEMMAQLHPRPKQPDEAREWHRTPFGQVMVMAAKGHCQENADCTCDFDASGGLKQKKDDCPVKQISHAEQEQHEHFHSWFGLPVGWQDGYLEKRDLSVDWPGKPKQTMPMAPVTQELVPAGQDNEQNAASPLDDQEPVETAGKGCEGPSAVEAAERPTYINTGSGKCKLCGKTMENHWQSEDPAKPYCYGGHKWVWHGPEDDPRWLDTLVWKPLGLVGPTAIKNAGAVKTVENLRMGRDKDLPRQLLPKRSYFREETYKDKINGGTTTIKYKSNMLLENNIHTTDWLTGATLYRFDQNAQTKTNSTGHGIVDKNELVKRKEAKIKVLERNIGEFEKSVLHQQKIISDAEADCLAKQMTIQKGRHIIESAENLIAYHNKQMDLLMIRLDQEKREIKAIEHEVNVKHVAKDLWIPKSIALAMDLRQLKGLADFNQSLNPLREAVGLPAVGEEGDESGQEESESDDDDGLNMIGYFFKGQKKQSAKGLKGEKYFGKPLIIPATGMSNVPVVKQKNADTLLKAKEENKIKADIFLARSQGKPVLLRPVPKQRRKEREARFVAQEKVDNLLLEALALDPLKDLEAWAKSEERRFGVFGSSAFPAEKPQMETVKKLKLDEYLKFPPGFFNRSRYEAVAATNDTCKHCGKNRPFHETNQMYCFDTEYRQVTKGENMEDQIKPGSSSGKVMGSFNQSMRERESEFFGYHQVVPSVNSKEYELANWGPQFGDQWAVGKALRHAVGKDIYSSDATDKIFKPNKDAKSVPVVKRDRCQDILLDRPFNGPQKK